MSYNSQALTAYRETSVKTASKGSLIIMLYDEGIKRLQFAIELLSVDKIPANSIELINNHIIKAQEIITELMASLNMEAGGEIASNLMAIYSYFYQQLLQANIKKDSKPLAAVKSMMEDLRLSWKQAIAAEETISRKIPAGINVAG